MISEDECVAAGDILETDRMEGVLSILFMDIYYFTTLNDKEGPASKFVIKNLKVIVYYH
jgi:hypothetical protein